MGVHSRIGIAIVAATSALAPLSANAADGMSLAAPPLVAPADDSPVTFATGWYLRGDLGVSQDVKLSVGAVILPSKGGFPNSWNLGFGAGYKFNDWIRADLTLDWRAPRAYKGNTMTQVCTIGYVLTSAVTEAPVNSVCNDYSQARITNTHVLFNVYADLGTWMGVTPYVGVGGGFNYVYQKVQQNWYMLNGNRYNLYVTDALNPTLNYYFNWDQARSVGTMQFAWAAMMGFSYALTPNLSVDVGGRYLNLGRVVSISSLAGASTSQKNIAKDLRIGFRYTPD